MSSNPRVAIIGGGIAGFVAATELQRIAPQVEITIFERSKNVGGRASTVQKNAAYFNQGAHALYNNGALNKFLEQLGILPAGGTPPQNNALAFHNGSFKKLPGDLLSVLTTSLFSASEKLSLILFLSELPTIDSSLIMDVPTRTWLESRFGRSTLAKLIETIARLSTYSNGATVMSAGAAVEQLKTATAGVKYLDFGWQNIISELHKLLNGKLDLKVDVEVTAVQEVLSERGTRVAVNAGDVTELFDSVILAVPPNIVEKIAPGFLPKNFGQTLAASKIACFDLCLESLPNPQTTFVLGLDDPLYYSVHSAAAKLSDDGSVVLHMGVYLEPGETGDERHLKLMTDMLDQLQPAWESRVIYKRFLPNMVASYATPLAKRNGVGGLSTPELPGASQVFAAGDWVGTGHFLADASAASAIDAAGLVAAVVCKNAGRQFAACG